MTTSGPSYPPTLTPEQEAADYERLRQAEAQARVERRLREQRDKAARKESKK